MAFTTSALLKPVLCRHRRAVAQRRSGFGGQHHVHAEARAAQRIRDAVTPGLCRLSLASELAQRANRVAAVIRCGLGSLDGRSAAVAQVRSPSGTFGGLANIAIGTGSKGIPAMGWTPLRATTRATSEHELLRQRTAAHPVLSVACGAANSALITQMFGSQDVAEPLLALSISLHGFACHQGSRIRGLGLHRG